MHRSRRNGEAGKDGVWGFGGSLGCHRVFCSHLVALTLRTRLSVLPRNGSQHGRPVKRRQKKRLKMRGRSVVAVRPPSTGHRGRSRGRLSPTWMESQKEDFVVFHLLFIWMLSLLLVCLLLWNSVISLIMKFKYINFYLVYRYLFNFSVGALVCECVWGYVMHVAYCVRTSEGMWS